MKKLLFSIVWVSIILACSPDKNNLMIVQGEVKNLKKGTLYLQKVIDTVLVAVDSVSLDGTNEFTLTDEVESPQIYFLSLDNSPNKQLTFFGETGTINIVTRLDKFNINPKIEGLANQQLLDEYNAMKSQYTGKRLDLLKADFEAKKDNDSLRIDSIANAIDKLIKSKYRYTANFIITHPDKEVSPYLALTEIYDANKSWLDSINNSLTPKVKASKYGQELETYLLKIKEGK